MAVDWTSTSRLGADALSVSGYALFSAALVIWLAASGRRRSKQALLDALLVGVGGILASWAVLVAPALSEPDLDAPKRLLFALYPVLDIVLLTLLIRLAFSRPARYPAFWFLITCISFILAGDIIYALDAAGAGVPVGLADAPYCVAYGAIAAASIHPSRRRLSAPSPARFDAWSRARLVGITIALLTPCVLLVAVPAPDPVDRTVRAVLAAALALLVIGRTVDAINGYASAEQVAHHRASHDDLTGMPNRLLLRDFLSVELVTDTGTQGQLSVLFIDLDGFKLVNDSYGHGVGDELLIAAAERIRATVRDHDFVARLGGDEFVVVSRHADIAGAEGLAERLIRGFENPFPLSIGPVYVSPSIGIARAAAQFADAESLLQDADTAMYKAKAAGRNRFAVFDTSLRQAVQNRIDTETGLRHALDRGEFEVHYQPVVDMSSGEIIGYEALLRWRHPDRGLVLPADFIPIAEESWLMVPIGSWVLREALAQLAIWRREGRPDLHISVNVSARQLRDSNLVGLVSRLLRQTGLPGEALCLELTESALVEDPVTAGESLSELRSLGVSIAVDDFGTGYSALGYLKQFPVSIVKIDREFVDGLSADPDDINLVRAIVAMAHALGLEAIAEGVETTAQETALRAMGCRLAQGWRYGRPHLPGHQLDDPEDEADLGEPLADEAMAEELAAAIAIHRATRNAPRAPRSASTMTWERNG
jgi:diguanylate cyclase (GGDEF)-like protein